MKFRNRLVHSEPEAQRLPLTGLQSPAPGRPVSVEARKSCLAVRQSLLAVAEATGRPAPRYLAYCPAGDAEDDELWATATVLTGLREDPDFPRLSPPWEATPD